MTSHILATTRAKKSKRRIRHLLAAAALVPIAPAGLVACTSVEGAVAVAAIGQDSLVGAGRQFASLRCASCHAMDANEFGSNPNAPPLKRLLPRLEFKMLERGPSKEGDLVHGTMPPLRLGMSDKDALVAYLESIAE